MNFKQNEEAVSPVIGVILMVAITVILAAVIAAFVFGMTGNVQTTKTVAVTVGQNGDNVILTYQGGADAGTLDFLKVTVGSAEPVYIFSDDAGKKAETSGTEPSTGVTRKALPVGASISIPGATGERDHVVLVGHFVDGADQVVVDTYV